MLNIRRGLSHQMIYKIFPPPPTPLTAKMKPMKKKTIKIYFNFLLSIIYNLSFSSDLYNYIFFFFLESFETFKLPGCSWNHSMNSRYLKYSQQTRKTPAFGGISLPLRGSGAIGGGKRKNRITNLGQLRCPLLFTVKQQVCYFTYQKTSAGS